MISSLQTTPPAWTTADAIEATVIEQIEEMTEDWDWDDIDDVTLSPTSQLIGDLDFASVDFVQLFVAIEAAFGRKFGFHDLIMPADTYVDDLSVADIVAYIQSRLNPEAATAAATPALGKPVVSLSTEPRLTSADFAQFQQLIPTPPSMPPSGSRNPPAIFILSPPRSGSTLFRVMLAGHPQLFVPPELHLLTYRNLQERSQALDNDLNRHLLSGTLQALQHGQSCTQAEAMAQMATYTAQNLSVQQFYQKLQQPLTTQGRDRILIDKTPSYTYHLHLLQRMESLFENALYIHLSRHPYGMIRSFTDAKLDQLVPFLSRSPFSARQRAELIWATSQHNIQTFLHSVDKRRQLHVRYEDLVKATAPTMQKVCQFLQLPFNNALLNPYESLAQRMTAGNAAGNEVNAQMSGDLKFHLHSQIEAGMADRWRQFHTEDFLSDTSLTLARTLGYEV
ncbi:MAG: sulfotransferase [Phormidesmis sp.]